MLLCKLKGFVSGEHLALYFDVIGGLDLVSAFEVSAFCLSGAVRFVHGASDRLLIDEYLIIDVAFFHDDVDALLAGEESAGWRMVDLRVILRQFIIYDGESLSLAAIDQMHNIFIRQGDHWWSLSEPHELDGRD